VQILAKEQNKTSYGQAQNANSTPEVNDEEMLSHSGHYIHDYFSDPDRKHAHYVSAKGIETAGI